MSSSTKGPKFITFYSYKGGTGRSMALANVAWILASNRKKVLVMDWDLEAPGLHRYFHPFLLDKDLSASEGVIDFVIDFSAAAVKPTKKVDKDWFRPYANILRYATSLNWPFPKPGTLDFVPAGRQGPDYAIRVNSFNWQSFYERHGGGIFLEAARQSMNPYDYVLIDSRTGVSDTSGICTVQMPDILVVCFTYNIQSIEGAAAVAESAYQQRIKPNGDPGLKIFPIPTRVELAEKNRLDLARIHARDKFDPLLWHIAEEKRDAYWGGVEVLYQPYYAFEEVLATFGDLPTQNKSILSSMEEISRRITEEEVKQFPPLPEEVRKETVAKYERKPKPVPTPTSQKGASYLFFFSYSKENSDVYTRQFFDDLNLEVRALSGLPGDAAGFFDAELIEPGEFWPHKISDALRTSKVLVSLISPAYLNSAYCAKEFNIFSLRRKLLIDSVGSASDANPILLVPWIPVTGRLPRALSETPSLSTSLPAEIAKNGLRYSSRLKKHRDLYQECVYQLAQSIVRLSSESPLPVLDKLPEQASVPGSFGESQSDGALAEEKSSMALGPRHVEFVYAAAGRKEMQEVRMNTVYYSEEGGQNWCPFLPDVKYDIGILAEQVAVQQKMTCQTTALDPEIVKRISEAEENNSVVILVIDPWSLKLTDYREIMREYDQRNFLNCGVLIIWNNQDEESAQQRDMLESLVRVTFPYHSLSLGLYFRDFIQSAQEFKKELETALVAIRSKIIKRSELLRERIPQSIPLPAITRR